MTATRELGRPAPLYQGVTYVIPCGRAKWDRPARARDLYRGQMFRHTLENAELAAHDEPARVLLLSGKHGLVELDRVLAPYDQRIDAPGAVSVTTLVAQAQAFGIGWRSRVVALLPQAYFRPLNEALRTLHVYPMDAYEGCRGNGEQRRVNAFLGGRPDRSPRSCRASRSGLSVWIGADVNAFWWSTPTPVLVSYDRLRDLVGLPVATAPWVLDSGGYQELVKHRGWTVSGSQYTADIRRYRTEIGRLVWAAAQDWPASPTALRATGLTEFEHQIRTTVSAAQLRAADTGVHILTVVTGTTPAGYLRHLDMYRRAGIDLHSEPLVGVGALLGRPPGEAAQIVEMLHAAGLHRLHLFGGKGRLLEAVGDLVTSIDSAGWSDDMRRRADLCPHGLVKWERNCPQAAREWAHRQRVLAAGAPSGPRSGPWVYLLEDLPVAV
ncbi:DUF6884 domain-containing protein [Actinoplanes sp. NPDC026623]|uniref:deazapurine DNA modification protein DpdA family protein n=1 Tax=Actinoplanes sp. NPDC026623 TaxID=3155610 RepID=UPI0033D9E303